MNSDKLITRVLCSRCRLPEWTHELWKCTPWHMAEYVGDDDLRREIVKREINQGALSGMSREVTEYAADLVLAALNRFDAWAGKSVMLNWRCEQCGAEHTNRMPQDSEE